MNNAHLVCFLALPALLPEAELLDSIVEGTFTERNMVI
jgi:hypothetical protein